MNVRQKQLLEHLLDMGENPVTLKSLASFVGCSERTVRNDFNQLTAYFEKENYEAHLVKKPGVGIHLDVGLYEKQKLQSILLKNKIPMQYSREMQQRYILVALLMAQEPLSLDELADRFFVNRSVIREDLEHVKEQVAGFQLELVSKPGQGTFVVASERVRREILAKLMREINAEEQHGKKLSEFFSPQSISIVNEALQVLVNETDIVIKDNPMNSIAIHILFMIERIKTNESLTLSDGEWDLIKYSKALTYSEQITDYLHQKLNIYFPKDEIGYLALRISSFNIHHSGDEDSYYQEISKEVEKIIAVLIAEIHHLLGIDLSEDHILLDNLKQHLESTFTRINSGFHIANPLKDEIRRTYTQLFLIVQTIVDEFFKATDITVPEEEVAYLTVHLQGALERQKKAAEMTYHTVIVCEYGMGVSAFLEAKINRHFPNIVVEKLVSVQEFSTYSEREQLDFAITTVPCQAGELPVLEVSPLLSEADLAVLHSFLLEFKPNRVSKQFDITRFSQPFLVETQMKATEKETVISEMVKKLVAQNYVAEGYLDTVLARESNSSTRIGSLIALPHGDPQQVMTSSISLATLETPLSWGNGDVQLVALLALKKEDMGQKELKNFFSILHYINESPELLHQIIEEKDRLKVLSYFKYYS
ncbi:BglG family transcription antiterminator [Vagococcus fessus]|uniref:Uncharacterized protein n=1 Tax=Vagococcus fessus TaxID=120370 RepID=A0A430A805_9ENTE|nr:BglG family transcription antiterminator [Vagococcus fessus]RSU03253.1 hypothetical protein CBF31_05930 [Vagococcus fessus]